MSRPPITRDKIPWFPSVRTDLCNGCGKCLEFCPHAVYVWDEEKRLVQVERPYECVIGCNNCLGLCKQGAISFPDLEKITEIIRKLREENAR